MSAKLLLHCGANAVEHGELTLEGDWDYDFVHKNYTKNRLTNTPIFDTLLARFEVIRQ